MPGPFETKDRITHEARDTDLSWSTPHHTIGKGPTQAAPGNHVHSIDEIEGYTPGANNPAVDLSLMAWTYDISTVMADPGSGKVRADTPQWSPTNNFAISTTTADGQNATADLAALSIGDMIYFQEALHPANWGTYLVNSAPIAHATWFQIPVVVGELHGGALRAIVQDVQARFLEGTGGGSAGVDDKNYVHTQGTMAKVWTVNHALGKRVAVTVEDGAGTTIYGTVKHVSDNQVTVTFAVNMTGKVYCN
jgi:hypothetical protein